MSTKMMSKLEVFDARLSAVEASLKNQEEMVTSHDSMFKEHSGLLTDITKTLTILRMEMRKGFQQQNRGDKGKDRWAQVEVDYWQLLLTLPMRELRTAAVGNPEGVNSSWRTFR